MEYCFGMILKYDTAEIIEHYGVIDRATPTAFWLSMPNDS